MKEDAASVLDQWLDNAETYVEESVDEVQDRISGGDDEAIVFPEEDESVSFAEKKTAQKSHKHTAAYVAGGITLAAAAVGALYLLKKRQERKGIEESYMGNEYVRSEAVL